MALSELSRTELEPGRKWLVVYQGSDPSAGNEIDESVPAGRVWRPLSILFDFDTDGTAANRIPILRYRDSADNNLAGTLAQSTIAANQDRHFMWAIGIEGTKNPETDADLDSSVAGNPTVFTRLIDIILPPGAKIQTITGAIEAGDDYGAPIFVVEETLV